MTPLDNSQTQTEILYNELKTRTWNIIERTVGILKPRFPVLSMGMTCELELAQRIVVICAVLHNIACEENRPLLRDRMRKI